LICLKNLPPTGSPIGGRDHRHGITGENLCSGSGELRALGSFAKMLALAPSALKSLNFQQMALFRQNGGRRW
jgi:hypothetical protein